MEGIMRLLRRKTISENELFLDLIADDGGRNENKEEENEFMIIEIEACNSRWL
jgi:hypothetical protein